MGDVTDPRDAFIARTVRGNSFVDVGGLWGTVNEKVSVAWQAGANALAMLDIAPAHDPLWHCFRERVRARGMSVAVDAFDGTDVQTYADHPGLPFDVVHCSGVLYHAPDPLRMMRALQAITGEYLILTSTVAPSMVHDAAPDGWLSIPALGADIKRRLADYWRPLVGDQAVGITVECEWNPSDFAPWWWLPTVDGLKRLCESVEFTVTDEAPFWNGNAHTLLLA